MRRGLPGPRVLRNDGVAGLTVTVSSVPDGMANGLLAGVNPIYGLYANMVAPVVGGLLSSSRLMIINSTSAAALVAGQSLLSFSAEDRADALFLMVILTGLIAVALGLLRLGRLVRFVSLSVMTGFVTGIAIVLILTQLPTISGITPTGGSLLTRTLDLVENIHRIHLPSLGLALLTLVLAVGLRRTPWLGRVSSLIAVGLPTAIAFGFSLDGVATVGDIGEISGSLPLPRLPSLNNLSVELVTGAFSVAIIAVIQGAGVSQTVPNPDGSPISTSRDFSAQGAANVAAGLFSGLPVGGSLSGTAVSMISGASPTLGGDLLRGLDGGRRGRPARPDLSGDHAGARSAADRGRVSAIRPAEVRRCGAPAGCPAWPPPPCSSRCCYCRSSSPSPPA